MMGKRIANGLLLILLIFGLLFGAGAAAAAEYRPYNLYLKLGYQYDDNIRLDPENADLFTDEADWVTLAYAGGKYNFLDRERLKVGAGLDLYQTLHNELHTYDLSGSVVRMYAKYRLPKFTFGISYLPTYYWLDFDRYLLRHQVVPEVLWKPYKTFATRLSYSYADNDYKNDSRDGYTHDTLLTAYYTVLDNGSYLMGGGGFKTYDTKRTDLGYDQWQGRLGVSVNLPWRLNAGVLGRYQARRYHAADPVFGKERDDDNWTGMLSLSRPVYYDWLSVMLQFEYTRNDSNISYYQYHRSATTLMMGIDY